MNAKRQQAIVDYINRKEIVSFAELRDYFHVSNATMRRDLVELANHGMITRTHGGAQSVSLNQHSPNLFVRLDDAVDEKEAIGQYAIQFIKNNDSIIMDASTTCLQLAKHIQASNLHVTIITNYFEISELFTESENIEVIFIGGHVRIGYRSTSGALAQQMLYNMHADLAFIGCDGIDPQRGLSNNRLDVIELKRMMIHNSKHVYCLADHTKFSTIAVIPLATFEEIDAIITNRALPNELLDKYQDKDKIILV